MDENFYLEQIKHGGMIVGIFNEDDSSISSFSAPIFDCATHERLKRNEFDSPMCWRWGRDGFKFFLPNYRAFTEKEVDLIYDHIQKKYRFDPVKFLEFYRY
jgi:hypothetical protein